MAPFYDPDKSYEENYKAGPFGELLGGEVFQQSGEPKFKFLGQRVFSTFGIPAGPLLNGRFIKAAMEKGFDLCTYKTVRTAKYPCNPMPNVVAVKAEHLTLEQAEAGVIRKENFDPPLTITNSFGVPSWDVDVWQKDMAQTVKSSPLGQVVIGSFQGTPRGGEEKAYIDDFVLAARLVKETGAKILEVNLSCPNEGVGHLLCFDVLRVQKVVEAIKNEIGNTPLIIKLAYFKDQAMLENLIDLVGKTADGVEAINTIPAKIVNEQGESAFPDGRQISGVCGAGIKWAGVEMVGRLKNFREEKEMKFAIIGVGGVLNADDFHQYLKSGADAVMSATGAMWNPFLAQEIKNQ